MATAPRIPAARARRAPPKPVVPERPARDREATKARILGAVGVVLARDGFGAVGVNAIAKEAGVDKVLIYRYFGGLPELLREWGASGRFWPRVADLLGADPDAFHRLAAPERYARFFEHFIDALRERPLTLEILAAEIVERNDADRHPRDRARGLGRGGEPAARGRRIRAPPGAARPDAAAGRRRAVPAGAQPQDPHLRRRRPDERRRLGRAEGIDPPHRARGDPLGCATRIRGQRILWA